MNKRTIHDNSFVYAPGGRRQSGVAHCVGLIIGAALAFVFFAVFLTVGYLLSSFIPALTMASADNGGVQGMHWAGLMYMIFAQFTAVGLALICMTKFWLGRPALTMMTSARRFRWNRFGLGFAAFGAIQLSVFALSLSFDPRIHFSAVNPATLAALAGTALIVLFIQTTCEELVARGYLVQLLGAFRLAPPVIITGTALLFALAHIRNPEMLGQPVIMISYLSIGIVFGLIAFKERGIELAAGAHFGNNLVATLLIRSEDSVFQTPSVFIGPAIADIGSVELIVSSLLPAGALLLLSWFVLPPAETNASTKDQGGRVFESETV